MRNLDLPVLPHQSRLLEDTNTRYVALVGGFGCGKTLSAVFKALQLASLNIGYRSVMLEPTHSMVVDVLIPTLDEVLEKFEIPHTYRASPLPSYIIHFEDGDHEILLRSAENYRRLAGLNLAFFICDEFDTIPKKTALSIFRMLQSRIRKGKVFQGIITTTPEGYNATYELFVSQASEDRKLIKARTADNPFLPDGFLENLMTTYPANLISAYCDGEFVNLVSSNVYTNYDRNLHSTDITENTFANSVLHIGIDFNIGKMAAVICVIKDANPYAVGELFGLRDTNDLIITLKRRYGNRPIYVYPDASGNSNKTNSSKTDIAQLQQAGFKVMVHSKNPAVRDRINSLNAMFRDGNGVVRLRVNPRTCPTLVECLEKQSYNSNGEPDKSSGFDHMNDAFGYFVYYHYPLIHNRGTRIINVA